jgi:hypothetical protein
MFHPAFGAWAGLAAFAQVEHEARIARGETAERGRRHPRAAQEDFDLADQHGDSSSPDRRSEDDGDSTSRFVAAQILLV